MNNEFSSLMNQICGALLEGEIWHGKAGNECRKIALRGFGRWHDSEARCDMETRLCLEKLLRDKLGYAPTPDVSGAVRSASMALSGVGELPAHLQSWQNREKAFAATLTKAMRMAAEIDIDIYKELIALTGEVQGEAMRVRLCGARLELAQWSSHDIGIVSMILHKHFEEHPDDKYINVNLG